MFKKKLIAGLLTLSLALPVMSVTGPAKEVKAATKEITIEKATTINPIAGFDDKGNTAYGGDPSILVDGDTVYLYVGHDVATTDAYNITEYLCYSTKDLKEWKYEGVAMKASTAEISWANSSNSAWAAQVMKHNGKYYLYYCTWSKSSIDSGKQCIGVAVSDNPTSGFKDIGKPLVKGSVTDPQTSDWNDIDPTAWIETDEKGVEHHYLAWGNGKFYVCELNEDMTSVKDLNGDGKITSGTDKSSADIIEQSSKLTFFTEAPWLYRRKDASGKPYGKYYLFYAYGWRERMAYATADDLFSGDWKTGGVIMEYTATSNTNHMAVFDFNGKTYFVYHNGQLAGGNGFRRSACIAELKFDSDGAVQYIPETAAGPFGKTTSIYTNSGALLAHENKVNPSVDSGYPMSLSVGAGISKEAADKQWVITAGKADEKKDSYVSIESENKPGLYLTAKSKTVVTLTQDTDGKANTANKQTFKTVEGLSDAKGVSFESVAYPGNYLSIKNGSLVLTSATKDPVASTFYLGVDSSDSSLRSIAVTVKKPQFLTGTKVKKSNLTVTAVYANGKTKKVTNFTSTISKITYKKAGAKTIKVTYKEGSITRTTNAYVTYIKKPAKVKKLKAKLAGKKKVKLTWKKVSGVKGYEVSYGKKKSKHKVYKTTSKCKVTFSGKKGTTYYLHVRSYVKLNGKKSYSKYKTVKIKVTK